MFKKESATFDLPPGPITIQFAVESRIDRGQYSTFYEAMQDQYYSDDSDFKDSQAEISITRIKLTGIDHGGAETCTLCPKGSISYPKAH